MPSGTIERVGQGLRRRAEMLAHRGDGVVCPACGHSFTRFKNDWNRPDALCWRCGSHERHRALSLLFSRRPQLLESATAMLHFAPEWCIQQKVDPARNGRLTYRYVTTDLDQPGVDLHTDITAMTPVRDGEFDAIICSHVLEHVPDDAAAMRELARVTAPGGWCLVMVPLDPFRSETYEDWSIVDPEQRERAFLQHDHVRLYGLDLRDRLTRAGFSVEVIEPVHEFGELIERCRLLPADLIYLCRPAG